MKRILLYYNFILITLMTIVGFVSAQSPADILSAVIFYPLAVYVWVLVMPKKSISIIKIPDVQKPKKSNPKLKVSSKRQKPIKLKKVEQDMPGIDPNRRMFLRLIGSAGIGVFFLTLFTRKAEAAFFGSVPGPGTVSLKDTSGTQINPAEKQPTDGYSVSEIDDTSSPAYYGFIDKTGAWYIIKDDTGEFRYVKGSSSFSTNWTNRASLSYDYFDVVF